MNNPEPTKTIRRILAAIDTSQPSEAALRAAVDLAQRLQCELVGVFVEDENLLRMADISFSREIRAFSSNVTKCTAEDMHRQLRARADRARHLLARWAERAGVPYSFRTVRGQVAAALLSASTDADLISLGRVGHTKAGGQTIGSTAEAVLQRAARSVMILEHRIRLHPPVLAVYDGSDFAQRGLRLAGEITRTAEYEQISVVILATDDDRSDQLESQALEILRPYERPVAFERVTDIEAHRLLHTIQLHGYGLVLTPGTVLEKYPREVRELITSMDIPLLVVR